MLDYIRRSKNIITAYLCLTSCLTAKEFVLASMGIAKLPGPDRKLKQYHIKCSHNRASGYEIWFIPEEDNYSAKYMLREHVPTDIGNCMVTWHRTNIELVTGYTGTYARFEIVLPDNFDWSQKPLIGGIIPERKDIAPVVIVLYDNETGNRREFQIYEGDKKPLVCLSQDSPALSAYATINGTVSDDTVFRYYLSADDSDRKVFLCTALSDPEAILAGRRTETDGSSGRLTIDVDKAMVYLSENFTLTDTAAELCEAAFRYWNTGRTDDAISVYLANLLGPIGFSESDVNSMSKNGIII